MNRAGLSEVISTVLTVMITIAAVAIVANVAIPFVRTSLTSSTECFVAKDFFKFDDSAGYDCYDAAGLYGLTVKAGNGGEFIPSDQNSSLPHSADTNRNWTIELSEYQRVVFLASMGGVYHVDPTTVDGFAPGAGSQNGDPHSADYNKDWKIDATELARVSQLQSDPTFKGKYKTAPVDASNPDGFAPGLMVQSATNATIGNNISGFSIKFISNADSANKKYIEASSPDPTSTIGGTWMIENSSAKIYVPRPGEEITYVYNGGNTKYSSAEIYPTLQSGKICPISDTITFKTCQGVVLS